MLHLFRLDDYYFVNQRKHLTSEDSLSNRVYYAAKYGSAMTLYSLLSDLSSARANKLINETVAEEYEGQYTPLMIAAERGRERVIKMLLSEFKPDLEKEGVIIDNPHYDTETVMEGTTALWCAARSGYLKGIKLLVKAGADVNHATRTNLTPLRMACREGHLDIVKYLTDHHADVNIADTHKNTCLMVAVKEGHLHVVNLLLKNKADPNMQALCGTTALHYAAEYGHISILKRLLNYNAKFSVNNIGMTPFKAAAESTHEEIVEYLLTRPEFSKEEKIEALELLGASYASNTDDNCTTKVYKYLHRAMKMRYSDPDNIIEKKLIKPIPAYENWIESQNLSELEALEHSSNELQMEALTIRERILGQHNPNVPDFILFRGIDFVDDTRLDRCIELYLHALHLKQLNKVSTADDLLRFVDLLKQMVTGEVEVTFDNVVQVLAIAIVELEKSKSKIASPAPDGNRQSEKDDIGKSMTATLYFLRILTELFHKCNEEERLNVNRMVSTLNHLHVKLNDGKTLLHMACDINREYYAHLQYDDYPCAETVQLLIRCGADVNAMDYCRNTPCHLIVANQHYFSDFVVLQLIEDFAEAGAHIYCLINKEGTSVYLQNGSLAEKLKTQANLSVTSLKCVAAIAVKSHGLSYQGLVPEALESFIELHSAIGLETLSD